MPRSLTKLKLAPSSTPVGPNPVPTWRGPRPTVRSSVGLADLTLALTPSLARALSRALTLTLAPALTQTQKPYPALGPEPTPTMQRPPIGAAQLLECTAPPEVSWIVVVIVPLGIHTQLGCKAVAQSAHEAYTFGRQAQVALSRP